MPAIRATREITRAGWSKVLVLTTFDHDSYLFGALEAGADGFLLKSAEPAEITAALQRGLPGSGKRIRPTPRWPR